MILSVVFLIIGLIFGSFLNVLIFRFPDFKDLFFGRSKCQNCKKEIVFFDLIPILSFIFLVGRCRFCRKRISFIYPLVEASTGVLFLLLYLHFGLSYSLILYLALASISILIFVYDIKYLEIPEFFSWLLLIVAILSAAMAPNFSISNFLFGGLIGGGVLGILVGISDERWMGSGDIKIGLAFGLLLGLEKSILFLFLSFVVGAFFGVILLAIKRGKAKHEIAFAPFLIIAAFLAILWGEELVNFYLKFVII